MSRGGGDKQVAKKVGRLEGKPSEYATSLTPREGERRRKEGGRREGGEQLQTFKHLGSYAEHI